MFLNFLSQNVAELTAFVVLLFNSNMGKLCRCNKLCFCLSWQLHNRIWEYICLAVIVLVVPLISFSHDNVTLVTGLFHTGDVREFIHCLGKSGSSWRYRCCICLGDTSDLDFFSWSPSICYIYICWPRICRVIYWWITSIHVVYVSGSYMKLSTSTGSRSCWKSSAGLYTSAHTF